MPKPENIVGKGFEKFPERINRKGRPKLPDLKAAVAAILADEKNGKTALDKILAALKAKAEKGDIRAAQELLDRAYGKSKQQIDHTGESFITNVVIKVKKNDA